MALLSSILSFSLFGLGARIGQLGIQKRNILESASSFPLLHPSVYLTCDAPGPPSCARHLSTFIIIIMDSPFYVGCAFIRDGDCRPWRAYHLDARFWLSRLLGTSVGRARVGAYRREACRDHGAAQAEDRAG